MDQPAWLDDLSEDWPSDPEVEVEVAPAKGPLPHPGGGLGSMEGSSGYALNERSFSQINIPRGMRHPSKLSQAQSARSLSVSSAGSVVHNTCHRNEHASPSKGDTPEWKRRLINGNLDAGEQPDLFTGARTGLESMFQQPMPGTKAPARNEFSEPQLIPQNDTTLPSSPPAYAVDGDGEEGFESQTIEESPSVIRQRTQSGMTPRHVAYRMVDSDEASRDASSFVSQQNAREVSGMGQEGQEPSSFSEIPLSALSRAAASSSSIPQQPRSTPPAPFQLVDPSRQASSQSVVRNEDLSPITMSPQKDQHGRITFAPMTELQPCQLQSKLEKLRQNQMLLDSNSRQEDGDEGSENSESEGLMKLGAFINCQRGGRSAEGSFRHRLLSPCDTSDMLPEDSLQASTPKQFPSYRTDGSTRSPVIPAAPYPSPEKTRRRSPLRNVASLAGRGVPSMHQYHHQDHHHQDASVELESASTVSEVEAPQTPPSEHPHNLSTNRFGSGRLNGFEFHEEVSYESNPEETDLGATDKENCSPDDKLSRARTTLKFDLSALSRYDFSVSSPAEHPGLVIHATPKPYDSGFDPKRPRSSPSKNPTPKRRRTLHESDVGYGLEVGTESRISPFDSVQHTHQRMQAVLGKKRKDGRNGERHQRADSQVLASRQILRPRNPTPRSSQREARPLSELPLEADESNLADHSVLSEDVSASFAAPMRTPRATARKPSIKTQDFLDEAEKIMAMIRNKARPAGLSSVEESEIEHQSFQQENSESFEESSVEPFSRPPSRDGGPLLRMSTKQDDPELVQRLKKYEERSDMGDLITSSLRSLGLVKDAMAAAAQVEREVNEVIENRSSRTAVESEVIDSDLPNVRITSNPHLQAQGPGFRSSHASHGSHGSSQASSVPSATSSRGSESWKTIPPQNVSHLIPDQVGNMVLDRDHNVWIKQKKMKAPVPVQLRNILPSEDSEDDPFASIPDLTVDATFEMKNLRLSASQKPGGSEAEGIPYAETPSPTQPRRTRPSSLKSSLKKPLRRSPLHQNQSNAYIPANNETLLENDKEVEQEITIHEDGINSSPPRKKTLTISFSSPIASIIRDVVRQNEEDGQNESGSPTGSASPDPDQPLNDITNHSAKRGRFGSLTSNSSLPRPSKGTPTSSIRTTSRRISVAGHPFIPRPISRIEEREEDSTYGRMRSACADSSALVPSEKGEEESGLIAVQKANTSLSFMVTPNRNRTTNCSVPDEATPVIGQCVGTLSLSPLSEFTINHGEQSLGLEVSYLVGEHRLTTGDGSKRVMSMSVKDLVNRIAEVVPFEPDWEDLRELTLSRKSLKSLHKLDQFCGGLVTLDASRNQLCQLDGAPTSIRNLKVTDNSLTELTGWGHLMNLQYLDVSNNELKSLSALKGLVHLRDVKADNNQISSLSDLLFHDGLQSLRARGNLIEEVDFEGTNMHHLAELDLENNRIASVSHIEALTRLGYINLQHNRITEFKTTKNRPFHSLKYLRLADNDIRELDISNFPALRLLHADRNSISSIKGLGGATRLDSLSLREQKPSSGDGLDTKYLLAQACEVRKLFLSGNLLSSGFEPQVDFLNLQYLEIANCGLASLPARLGQMCPNLRVLNANFNGLEDIRPLADVPRLKKLLLAGNRLAMERDKVVAVLEGFPRLREVDLRDNPCTQGFYAPASGGGGDMLTVIQGGKGGDGDGDRDVAQLGPFELGRGSKERDEKFASRLDPHTRMRRRLYEILMTGACERIRWLDGLEAPRGVGGERDAVWKGLSEEGLLSVQRTGNEAVEMEKKKQTAMMGKEGSSGGEDGLRFKPSVVGADGGALQKGGVGVGSVLDEGEGSTEESERWGAEDSFAG